ncbi:MAG: hypothetical protein WD872_17665 [Pirellulaceae bacterium]
MRVAEKALLLATRNRLRLAVNVAFPSTGGAGFAPEECNCEFDEIAPVTAGQRYVAVMPGGWRPGHRHNTSGGVNDLLYGVDVLVVVRAAHVPRDRTRDVFVGNLGALDEELDKIFPVIDFNEHLRNDANAIIAGESGSAEGFIENLRFVGTDPRPRLAPAELFAGRSGEVSGLMRVLHFHGARRITVKT